MNYTKLLLLLCIIMGVTFSLQNENENKEDTVTVIEGIPLYRTFTSSNTDHFYTQDEDEFARVKSQGYADEGVLGYVLNKEGFEGSVPLYRLYKGAINDHFYCVSAEEKDRAVSVHGYTYEGIVGWVFTEQIEGTIPIYRHWNGAAGDHFYTNSKTESDSVPASGWAFEGIEYYIFETDVEIQLTETTTVIELYAIPLYRTFTSSNTDHFYTQDEEEFTRVVSQGYSNEGVLGYLVDKEGYQGTTPLYRLYKGAINDHFYCVSAEEKDRAVSVHGYTYEGIVGWVFTEQVEGTIPIYRHWNGAAGDHFYTNSKSESDSVPASGWAFEGIEFYLFEQQVEFTSETQQGSLQTEEAQSQIVHLGCFVDAGSRDLWYYQGDGHSIESCLEKCDEQGYRYAGLQYFGQCFCDYNYGAYGQKDQSECNTACKGNSEQLCGGTWRNDVYDLDTNYVSIKDQSVSLGCYVDAGARDLANYIGDGYQVNNCLQACYSKGYKYAGVQYYSQCFCDNNYGMYGEKPMSECQHACTANKEETCGGTWRNEVYTLATNISEEPSAECGLAFTECNFEGESFEICPQQKYFGRTYKSFKLPENYNAISYTKNLKKTFEYTSSVECIFGGYKGIKIEIK